MARRLMPAYSRKPLLTVTRQAIQEEYVVYLILSNRPITYKRGASKIVYIGTTKKGIVRIARSTAARALSALRCYGVQQLDVHTVTCDGRQGVRTWEILERAMLLTFKALYGEPLAKL